MKKTLLFVVVCTASLLTLALSGCSKKNGSSSYDMKSISGTYKLTSSTITYGGQTVDYMPYIDDCEKDDNLKLNTDSTEVYTDAGTVCSSDGSYTGKWYVSGSQLIQIDQYDSRDTATIKSFNGTSLVLTLTGDYMNTSATLTTTLTKQ